MTASDEEGDLRRRAATRLLEGGTPAPAPASEEDLRRLLHELQVHQVELELQNEELLEAKAEVERSHERYAALYDLAPVGYFTLDPRGVILTANLRGAGLLGVEKSRLAGRLFGLFVAADGRRVFEEFLARVFSGEATESCEVSLRSGEENALHVRLEGAVSEGGFDCRATVSDVTARKRAEAEAERLAENLRQSQKMEAVGTLAGGIAHDFNNILTPIMAHAELALLHLLDPDSVRADLKEILTATTRAADLVRQILAIGRRRDQSGGSVPVPLGPLVKETAKFLRASLPSTIEIRTEIDPGCGSVLGDPSQLYQVLLNLCTNAGQAMHDQGGVLSVSVAGTGNGSEGRWVRLAVHDTGPGIPEHLRSRIFEPYFTTKPVGKGSGLGLAVVEGIVAKLGGTLRVESVPGEGTTFEVRLPQVPADDPAPKLDGGDMARGGGRHVLVVDDEPSIRLVLVRLLGTLGYRVTPCAGGPEALAVFSADSQGFDAVFTDYTMPGMTGLDLARGLLLLRPDLPIVLATGFSTAVDAQTVARLGVRRLLMKPYTSRELGEALRDALDGPLPSRA